MGTYFEEQLHTLKDLPVVGDVRGKRFMICIENVANKVTKELIDAKAKVGDRIANHCEEKGLLVRPLAHMNILSPPLILTKENVDFLVSTLRSCIEKTIVDLKKEGFI